MNSPKGSPKPDDQPPVASSEPASNPVDLQLSAGEEQVILDNGTAEITPCGEGNGRQAMGLPFCQHWTTAET